MPRKHIQPHIHIPNRTQINNHTPTMADVPSTVSGKSFVGMQQAIPTEELVRIRVRDQTCIGFASISGDGGSRKVVES